MGKFNSSPNFEKFDSYSNFRVDGVNNISPFYKKPKKKQNQNQKQRNSRDTNSSNSKDTNSKLSKRNQQNNFSQTTFAKIVQNKINQLNQKVDSYIYLPQLTWRNEKNEKNEKNIENEDIHQEYSTFNSQNPSQPFAELLSSLDKLSAKVDAVSKHLDDLENSETWKLALSIQKNKNEIDSLENLDENEFENDISENLDSKNLELSQVHQLMSDSIKHSSPQNLVRQNSLQAVDDYMKSMFGSRTSESTKALKQTNYANAISEWRKIHNERRLDTCIIIVDFVKDFLESKISRNKLQNTVDNVGMDLNLGGLTTIVNENNKFIEELKLKENPKEKVKEIKNECPCLNIQALDLDFTPKKPHNMEINNEIDNAVNNKIDQNQKNDLNTTLSKSSVPFHVFSKNRILNTYDFLDGLSAEYSWVPKYAVKISKVNNIKILEITYLYEHTTNVEFKKLVVKDKNGVEYELNQSQAKAFLKICPIFASSGIEIKGNEVVSWDDFWWMQNKINDMLKEYGYVINWKAKEWYYDGLWTKSYGVEFKKTWDWDKGSENKEG